MINRFHPISSEIQTVKTRSCSKVKGHWLKYISVILVSLSAAGQIMAQSFADFETPEKTPALANGNAAVVDNPFVNDINPSSKCARYEKAAGNWHYVSMQFPQAVSFEKNTTMTFKVHSSVQGRVYYKFWNGGTVVAESWAHDWSDIPPSNQWVQLTMDISGAQGQSFTTLEIAAGVDNNSEAIIYLDDFRFSNPLAEEGIPVLDLEISPVVIYTDSTVSFDASGSFDWNDLPLTFDWNFGDGTTVTGASIEEHVYSSPGYYQAVLTLSNSDGKSVTKTIKLFVFDHGEMISGLTFTGDTHEVYGKAEGIFKLSKTYANPYNPDTVKVDAIITGPDNDKDTIPCFYYIQSSPVNSNWVNDSSFQCWMLRFTPEKEGEYRVMLKVKDKELDFSSDEFSLNVLPSDNKGFVYIDPENRQYYRHSTGEPYLPIGENVAWSNKSDKIADYYDHIKTLGENNANMLRYWTVTFAGQSLEAKNGFGYYKGIGIYSQEAAAMLDSVFNLAREYDIQIMLAIWQHGILSENVNPNWDLNPYNTANGGFLDKPAQFFNDEYAKYLTRNLLRYYVARWGYSTNLHSWEFFNEVDLTGNTQTNPNSWVTDVDNWHEEMGEYLREIDAYDHIRTTSLSGWMDHPLVSALGDNQHLDLLQFHSYDYDVSGGILARYANIRGKTDLPLMCGEFGKSELAETGDEVRRACWTGYFNHLPNLHWYWDKAIQQGWYSIFAPIASYFSDVDLVEEGNPETINIPVHYENETISATGIKTDAGNYYIYVYQAFFQSGISNASLELNGLPFGYYKRSFYNPVSGEISETDTLILANASIDFSLPTFSEEIALKLEFVSEYLHPVADAGRDQVLPVGMLVQVSGSGSVNPKGLPISFLWTLVSQPEGGGVTIPDPAAENFSFEPAVAGRYIFALVVSDSEESSFADTLTITISAPPVANAGDDFSAVAGTNVFLDGSSSYDNEGEEISYSWTMIVKPEGSNSSLKKDNYVDPVFRPDIEGEYIFVLFVNDGLQDSEPDTVKVTVTLTRIEDLTTSNQFNVYPNPFSDYIAIEAIPSFNGDISFEMMNLQGQIIMKELIPGGAQNGEILTIDVPENLSKGFYFLRIKVAGIDGENIFKIIK